MQSNNKYNVCFVCIIVTFINFVKEIEDKDVFIFRQQWRIQNFPKGINTPSVKRQWQRQSPIGMHCDAPKSVPDPFPSVMASVTRPVIYNAQQDTRRWTLVLFNESMRLKCSLFNHTKGIYRSSVCYSFFNIFVNQTEINISKKYFEVEVFRQSHTEILHLQCRKQTG